ncbi:MAG: S9 family peptidase [Acidobacteria bacterium]|nr:S9 family peptidase [Acidobacteriota bacterium]
MLSFRRAVLPLACLALAATPHLTSAQAGSATSAPQQTAPHFPTNEDLRHLKTLANPQLSPDGKQILFSVTNATADGAASHLWLVSVPGNGSDKPRQLTFSPPSDKRGEHNAQWAPDGSAIFFLAKRGEHTQLFRLDLRGGEASPYDLKILPPVDASKDKDAINPPPPAVNAEKKDEKKDEKKSDENKVEPLPIDVAGFSFSDDGKYIALWAHDPETPGEKKQKDAKIDASWVNHDRHLTRLYFAALKADAAIDGELKAVDLAPDVHGAVWSPVADKLFVVTEEPNDVSDLGPAGAAWIVDVSAGAKPQKLDAIPATVQAAEWTSDGSGVVFSAQTSEDAPPGYEDLFVFNPASPSSKPLVLSRGFNGQLSARGLYFNSDGSLVAPAAIGTRNAVVGIALDGKSQPKPIDLGAAIISGLNTNRKHTGWAWQAESGGHPSQLCYAAKLGDACTQVPTPDLGPANLRTIEPKLVQWKSGAFTVEGLLYLPPDTGAAKTPLLVDVHGGPFGAFENRHDPFVDFLVGHGWAVLRPNPRGSSNYGAKFAAANKNDLGGGDYQDVMSGVDYVLAHYPIDSARMALMGYSYGGEMAGFVEGKTDRFKAIISGAPVIDQFSEYGTEGGSWYDRWYFGKPWEHMNDAWRQSPLSGVVHAKTPFLLLQGESDTTDPVGQAQEMYRALRQAGVPVELVTYPRENHGPLAIGMFGRPSPEPWHGYDARQRIVKFIEDAFSSSH